MWKLIAWAIPGAQPFALLSTLFSWVGAVFKAIATFVRVFCGGLKTMSKDWKTWVVVLVVAGAVGGYAFRLGDRWNKHLLTKAEQRIEERTMERDNARKERDLAQAENELWKGRLDDQEKRAAEAEKAGKIAEDKARAALAARDRAQRLLNAPGSGAKAGPKEAAGPGLPSLQGLLWLGQ